MVVVVVVIIMIITVMITIINYSVRVIDNSNNDSIDVMSPTGGMAPVSRKISN